MDDHVENDTKRSEIDEAEHNDTEIEPECKVVEATGLETQTQTFRQFGLAPAPNSALDSNGYEADFENVRFDFRDGAWNNAEEESYIEGLWNCEGGSSRNFTLFDSGFKPVRGIRHCSISDCPN